MKEQGVKPVFLLSDIVVMLAVFIPGIICLFLGEDWSGTGVIIILCGLMMVPFYHHGYKLDGHKGVFRKKDVLMPRECKEEILAFLDSKSDVLDLHPRMQGGAVVDVYYRKGTGEAYARYFDYAEFAAGTEYPLHGVAPGQVKIFESYITKTKAL